MVLLDPSKLPAKLFILSTLNYRYLHYIVLLIGRPPCHSLITKFSGKETRVWKCLRFTVIYELFEFWNTTIQNYFDCNCFTSPQILSRNLSRLLKRKLNALEAQTKCKCVQNVNSANQYASTGEWYAGSASWTHFLLRLQLFLMLYGSSTVGVVNQICILKIFNILSSGNNIAIWNAQFIFWSAFAVYYNR